jgi:hypothetical protein
MESNGSSGRYALGFQKLSCLTAEQSDSVATAREKLEAVEVGPASARHACTFVRIQGPSVPCSCSHTPPGVNNDQHDA